jgi:ubiquinone/menaquinone biosynthesis C-methylase UbiE
LKGKKKLKSDQNRWDDKFRGKKYTLGREANPFLRKHIRLLPRGKALDVATGEGKNAVFLAQHGFEVEAVDISKKGLGKARRLAKEKGVKIKTVIADLDHYPIEKERYDLITDFYFLDRRLIPRIRKGLKKGGRVVFETYLTEHSNICLEGPRNPRYLLKPNELLTLFKGFRILFYREGIFREGGKKKAIASLIAEK